MMWSVNTSQEVGTGLQQLPRPNCEALLHSLFLAQVYAPATLAKDGTLLIGSQNGVLFAIDSQSGKVKWTFKDIRGLPMNAGPAIGDGRNAETITRPLPKAFIRASHPLRLSPRLCRPLRRQELLWHGLRPQPC